MSRKFIVAAVGTANTGKTTFKKDVLERFSSDSTYDPFTTNEIDYREKIESEGLQINRNGNLRSQKIIFECLADSVIQAVKDPKVTNFISDRSVIDAYVYTRYLHENNPDSGISERDLVEMRSQMEHFARLYDRIILFRMRDCENVKVVDDKFRDTDLGFRKRIDEIFQETVTDLHYKGVCEYTNLVRGTRNERIDTFSWMFSQFPPLFVRRNVG